MNAAYYESDTAALDSFDFDPAFDTADSTIPYQSVDSCISLISPNAGKYFLQDKMEYLKPTQFSLDQLQRNTYPCDQNNVFNPKESSFLSIQNELNFYHPCEEQMRKYATEPFGCMIDEDKKSTSPVTRDGNSREVPCVIPEYSDLTASKKSNDINYHHLGLFPVTNVNRKRIRCNMAYPDMNVTDSANYTSILDTSAISTADKSLGLLNQPASKLPFNTTNMSTNVRQSSLEQKSSWQSLEGDLTLWPNNLPTDRSTLSELCYPQESLKSFSNSNSFEKNDPNSFHTLFDLGERSIRQPGSLNSFNPIQPTSHLSDESCYMNVQLYDPHISSSSSNMIPADLSLDASIDTYSSCFDYNILCCGGENRLNEVDIIERAPNNDISEVNNVVEFIKKDGGKDSLTGISSTLGLNSSSSDELKNPQVTAAFQEMPEGMPMESSSDGCSYRYEEIPFNDRRYNTVSEPLPQSDASVTSEKNFGSILSAEPYEVKANDATYFVQRCNGANTANTEYNNEIDSLNSSYKEKSSYTCCTEDLSHIELDGAAYGRCTQNSKPSSMRKTQQTVRRRKLIRPSQISCSQLKQIMPIVIQQFESSTASRKGLCRQLTGQLYPNSPKPSPNFLLNTLLPTFRAADALEFNWCAHLSTSLSYLRLWVCNQRGGRELIQQFRVEYNAPTGKEYRSQKSMVFY